MFALERLAELVAQSVLDLAAMWAAAEGDEKPATYRDLAAFLARRIGGYGEFLRRLASFRNIIVHGYHQLDEASELEAFHEIVSTMPQIVKILEAKLPGDTCIDDVKRLREVFERHGVVYAVVFGSVAKRGCGRDLDLAVKFARSIGLWDLTGFVADVAEALDLDYGQVDVDAAPLGILLSILEGIPVYNEERAREDLARRHVELLDVGEAWRAAQRRLARQ